MNIKNRNHVPGYAKGYLDNWPVARFLPFFLGLTVKPINDGEVNLRNPPKGSSKPHGAGGGGPSNWLNKLAGAR